MKLLIRGVCFKSYVSNISKIERKFVATNFAFDCLFLGGEWGGVFVGN